MDGTGKNPVEVAEVAVGLEDVVVVESAISSIIDSVLTYRGIRVDELVRRIGYEEVAFLLWHGWLPSREDLDRFSRDVWREQALPASIIHDMTEYPKESHPMDVLRTAISTLALYDPDVMDMGREANLRKALRLLAKSPTAVAAFHRIRHGQQPIYPVSGLSVAENFLYMLRGERPERIEEEAMNTVLVVYADHELNASTFSARVTVSTLSDIYSAAVTGIGTLKGTLHGGANQASMEMLEEIGTVENVEPWLKDKLARHERVMGFGHRVYKHGDPRAKHLRNLSKELADYTGDHKWYDMSVKMEDLVMDLKGLYPNVDFYMAGVLRYLGIPTDLFTPIFAMGRMAGWTAHIMEQYANNRLIRPRAKYCGPTNRHFVPMDQRP